MREPGVAIAGCGVICPTGNDSAAFLHALRNNTSCLCPNERFSSARFQSNIVGTAPIDPTHDNPAYELARSALKEAVSEFYQLSTINHPLAPARTGLVLATTKANIAALERISDGRPCSAAARRHLQTDLLAADLATAFKACGPVQNISNACVSGLAGLMQGAKLIQRGDADAVFVVGVDHLSAFVIGGFTALKAIDPEGCRPFDQDRRGLSPGEAGAAVVLVRDDFLSPRQEPTPNPSKEGNTFSGAPCNAPLLGGAGGGYALTNKTRAPLITFAGWGSSNDANHMTGPSRDGAGLAQAIRDALAAAQITTEQIDYVNVHGTGTPYNDAMETAALRSVFGENIPPMSGIKGMIGHTLGAAGVIETIACTFAMREKFLPGTSRLNRIAEGFPPSLVKEPRAATSMKRVLKLNTGFGGVNGALILAHE